MPDIQNFRQLMPNFTDNDYEEAFENHFSDSENEKSFSSIPRTQKESSQPIIIETPVYDHAEEEEDDNLSLEDMEFRLISKALRKYKGRRKDAAAELGISERTLYRKIDKYRINE